MMSRHPCRRLTPRLPFSLNARTLAPSLLVLFLKYQSSPTLKTLTRVITTATTPTRTISSPTNFDPAVYHRHRFFCDFKQRKNTTLSSSQLLVHTHRRLFSSQSHHNTKMSSKLIPSNPADVMVIRNVTPNVATFSVPFSRFGRIMIGGRGTLVKLTSGSLAVFSPVALTDAAKAKVTEMGGDVRYIVALDFEHHIFVSDWAKEYPQAIIIGPEGLPEKRAKQQDDPKIGDEKFTVVFTKDNKREIRISDEFDADFEYEYVNAHANLEIVFFYKPDRVVIEADLLFNLPATEQYSKVPHAEKPGAGFLNKLFSGAQDISGDARWLKRANWYLSKDRESFNDSMKRIDQWDFVTLVPCHGDTIEGSAKEVFRKVFEWHINGHK